MFAPIEEIKNHTPTSSGTFPSPFPYPATCKPLEEWKKSVHYKVIDADIPRSWAHKILDEYTMVIREWLRSHHAKERLSHPAAFDQEIDTFRPADTKLLEAKLAVSTATPTTALHEEKTVKDAEAIAALTKAKDDLIQLDIAIKLSKALAYFLHFIVSQATLDRTRRAAVLRHLADGSLSTWKELKESVMWEHREESKLKALAIMLNQVRKEPLHEWVTIMVVHKAEFEKANISFPALEWVNLVTRQMNQVELNEFSQDALTSLDALYAAIKLISYENLPRWTARSVADKVKRWSLPSLTAESSVAKVKSGEAHKSAAKPKRDLTIGHKSPEKTPSANMCRDFARGKCTREKCKFSHEAVTPFAHGSFYLV